MVLGILKMGKYVNTLGQHAPIQWVAMYVSTEPKVSLPFIYIYMYIYIGKMKSSINNNVWVIAKMLVSVIKQLGITNR